MSAPLRMRMPDGTPLSAVLKAWESEEPLCGAQKRQRRGSHKGRKISHQERLWDAAPAPVASPLSPASALADEERERAALLSGRRRRRFLNDLFLKSLAEHPLLCGDISSLFTPAPFGRQRVSAFGELCEHGLRDAFVASDLPDKSRHTAASLPEASGSCAAAWARVGRRGRAALRRAVNGALPTLLHAESVLQSVSSDAHEAESAAGTEPACQIAGDSFSRLLVHSLCAWAGTLSCRSVTLADGSRVAVVRRRVNVTASQCAAPTSCSEFLLTNSC